MIKSENGLVDFILKNNLHLGSSKINTELEKFIFIQSNREETCLFNVYEQVRLVQKTQYLLRNILVSKQNLNKDEERMFLFCGLNGLSFFPEGEKYLHDINKRIFRLSYRINYKFLYKHEAVSKYKHNRYLLYYKKGIEDRLSAFYEVAYKEINRTPLHAFFQLFFMMKKKIKLMIKKGFIIKNGFFVNGWVMSSLSNHNSLKFNYRKVLRSLYSKRYEDDIDDYMDENALAINECFNLYNFHESAVREKKKLGGIIFFCQKGYDLFFKEFKRLGVPIISIVNNGENLDGIDYPLIGDNTNVNTLLFYLEIFENFFEKKKEEIKK